MSTVASSPVGHQAPSLESPRVVVKDVLAELQCECDGYTVRRTIGKSELKNFDPFVLLDEFTLSPPGGFPNHPHKGFEAVTYMLEGGFTHQDFMGNKSTIRAGDLQWTTIGRGIIHSEVPAGEGISKGLQLWINLSSKDKTIEPAFKELQSKDVATVEKDGVYVRIIAGEAFGVRSPLYSRTPTMYLDFTLKPGAQLHQLIPESWNAFVYIIEGEGVFGSPSSSVSTEHHTLVLSPGDGLSVWNKSTNALRFLLIGGQPLNEPVVLCGPFVMNTQEEIDQTFEDYRSFKNGFEKAKELSAQA